MEPNFVCCQFKYTMIIGSVNSCCHHFLLDVFLSTSLAIPRISCYPAVGNVV